MQKRQLCVLGEESIPIFAFVAVLLCGVALLFALAGCSGDMMATTTQAQGSGQAESTASASVSSGQEGNSSSVTASASSDGIEVTVQIDCANAHAYNEKFPETLGTFSITVPQDGTAFDALAATGVDYELRGKDYVSSIGGIEEKSCGRDSGWLYLVDGERPTINSTEYHLSGGETVRWAFTVTEGDVA